MCVCLLVYSGGGARMGQEGGIVLRHMLDLYIV